MPRWLYRVTQRWLIIVAITPMSWMMWSIIDCNSTKTRAPKPTSRHTRTTAIWQWGSHSVPWDQRIRIAQVQQTRATSSHLNSRSLRIPSKPNWSEAHAKKTWAVYLRADPLFWSQQPQAHSNKNLSYTTAPVFTSGWSTTESALASTPTLVYLTTRTLT